jgi:dTDP-4-amino-4,6-dideoxygalactose transaminase
VSDGLVSVWAPLHARWLAGRPVESLPYPLEDPTCVLYEWARHGLWNGLRSLGVGEGDEVFVPAYHHGSEVTALAKLGVGCRFYEATPDLEPDPEELERLLSPRVRALYLIHPLGFGLDTARWRRWCDDRGLLLIEDVAMAWLAARDGKPLGSWGDIAIFSPWKTFGLPDGGAAIVRGVAPPPQPPIRRGLSPGRLARGLLRSAAQRHGWVAAAKRHPAEASFDEAVEWDLGDPGNGPLAISLRLLRRAATGEPEATRRASYARLLKRLGAHVPAPFDSLQAGACPFGMPVVTGDKREVVAELLDRRIDAVDLWSRPHPLLPSGTFPAADRRRATTLLLPIHQDLTEADVERIGDVTLSLIREESS